MASVTKTTIANLALSLIKSSYTVASIDPPDTSSKASVVAAQWYDIVRREVLAGADWDFAKKRDNLSDAGSVTGWSASYQLPADYVRLSWLGDEFNSLTEDEYTIENGYILTNYSAPLPIGYIFDQEDTSKFSPNFVTAFAKRMSAYLARSLAGSGSMSDSLFDLAEDGISEAKTVDAQSNPPKKITRSRWARAKERGHIDRWQ